MKSIFNIAAALAIVSSTIVACTKTATTGLNTQDDFSNSTRIQVYNAILNATRNYVYLDGVPLTGATMSQGSLFPSGANSASIPGGLHAFLVRDTSNAASVTQVPLSFAENMQVGGNYTIFLYDTTTSPKQKTVATNIEIPTDTTARLRFAHFSWGGPTLAPAIDIFSKNLNRVIASNINYTDVTGFIPYPTGKADTFYVRLAGSGTNLNNITPATPAPGNQLVPIQAIFTPVAKRSYTLVFRGGFRTVGTTAGTVRTLSVFANY